MNHCRREGEREKGRDGQMESDRERQEWNEREEREKGECVRVYIMHMCLRRVSCADNMLIIV